MDPTEIKDHPCSSCGNWYPMDEFTEYDWDYQLCDDCVTIEKNYKKTLYYFIKSKEEDYD